MIRTTSLALAFGIAASTAHAAGPGDWAGGYIGGQIGYAYSDFSLNVSNFDSDSVIGGLTAGYLWALGSGWYLGPELQYDWANLTITDPATNSTATFNEMARLKVIAGYEIGQGLLYGSIGYAYANFDGVGTFFDGSGDSYVIGLGYDYAIDANWTIGGEYMFQSFKGIGSGGGDVDVNTVYIKATYRF